MKRYADLTPKIRRRKAQQLVALFAIRMADLISIVTAREILVSA
jgi:hypothetical protein